MSAQRVLEHRFGFGRKTRDEIGTEHDVRPQPAQSGAKTYGVGAKMAPLHAL